MYAILANAGSTSRGVALAMITLLAGACSDDAVHVRLEIPAGFQDRVESVTLDVLVPPVLTPFSCDDIAFHEVDEGTIDDSRVRQVVSTRRGSIAIEGIPRKGPKLLLARGFDPDEMDPVIAACAELGDVDGDVTVTLVGEATARVSLDEQPLGAPLPRDTNVYASDHNGDPLAGVTVKWAVIGPRGDVLPGEGVTDANGNVLVTPGIPPLPGPAALDIRVRWSAAGAGTMLGFKTPTVMFTQEFPGEVVDGPRAATEGLYQVGRIGPQGEMGFMALGPPTALGAGRNIFIVYRDPTAGASKFRFRSVPVPTISAATLGLYRETDRDHVVILAADKWIDVNPEGTFTETPRIGNFARRIVNIGPCDAVGQDLLLAKFDDTFGVFTPAGVQTTSPIAVPPPTTRLLTSGCASGVPGVYRTVVFGAPGTRQTVVAAMDVVRTGELPALQSGIGFSPAVGDSPPYLLGTRVDIDGISVARFELVKKEADMVDPESSISDPSPTVARSSAGGDVDGDGILDVVSLLDFGSADGISEFRVMVSLGVEHRDAHLVGLSGEKEGIEPRLFVEDFDGDGYDDVLIAGQTGFLIWDMGRRGQ